MSEFERLLAAAEFEHAVAAVQAEAAARVPYTRLLEGYPEWLLLTDSQWESYDAWNAHVDRVEAKYGRFAPRAVAAMRATTRKVW